MRQIGTNDINQILLTRLFLGQEGEKSTKAKATELDGEELTENTNKLSKYVGCNMRVRVDTRQRNEIVKQLLGHLSYRSREQIVRTLDSLTGFKDDSVDAHLDVLSLWSGFAAEHLEYRDMFYIRWNKFENWRRAYHALDEDLPCLCWLVRNEFLTGKIENDGQLTQRLKPWSTFLHGDDAQLYRELSRGMASLHLHVTGSYPAPFYWVAMMNDRISIDNTFGEGNDEQKKQHSLYRYRDEEAIRQIQHLVGIARCVRWTLFQFTEKLSRSFFKGADDDALFSALKNLSGRKGAFGEINLDSAEDSWKDEIAAALSKIAPQNGTDYAQTSTGWSGPTLDITCPSLIGERWLNFTILAAIEKFKLIEKQAPENVKSAAERLSQLYWTYVEAKNTFLNLAQQAEGLAGFDYFEYTMRMLQWTSANQHLASIATEIGYFLQESRSVVKQEFMIAPKQRKGVKESNRSSKGNEKKIEEELFNEYNTLFTAIEHIRQAMDARLSDELRNRFQHVRVGVIVHFIKDLGEKLNERELQDSKLTYRIYHYTRRDRNARELMDLAAYFSKSRFDKIKLLAIDTANRELYCPPEIFAQLYKDAVTKLRSHAEGGKAVPLKKTCHVGEDFVYVMTGMRRIYEAVKFLGMRPGDRLGHCVAMGVHPGRWLYAHPTVPLHIIDILDDAVFEWQLLQEYEPGSDARINQLQRKIDQYSRKVFGEPVPASVLVEAWYKRMETPEREFEHSDPKSVPLWVKSQGQLIEKLLQQRRTPLGEKQVADLPGAHSLVPSLALLPRLMQEFELECSDEIKLPADMTERVLCEYLYDGLTVRKMIQQETVDVSQERENVERIQKILRRVLADGGITIESNPTSNWLIGGFERHADIPAVQWQLRHHDLAITINSDDPAVFSTNLENEFFLTFVALRSGDADHAGLSRTEALERISQLRLRGLNASFL